MQTVTFALKLYPQIIFPLHDNASKPVKKTIKHALKEEKKGKKKNKSLTLNAPKWMRRAKHHLVAKYTMTMPNRP